MPKTATITARIDPELNEALERIAAAQGRSKSWVLSEMLREQVEKESAFSAAVQAGRESIRAGQGLDHDAVMQRWRMRRGKR